MHRVYFDANEAYGERYDLGIPGAQVDLASIPGGPKNGRRVILYTPGELEMEAELEFVEEHGLWVGRPIEGTTVIYPEAI